MAATNHTPVYQLNQWEGSDPVLRADFNADNLKIEEALKRKLELEVGSYIGTAGPDGGTQVIELGYRAKFIFVWEPYMSSAYSKEEIVARRAMAADGFPYAGVLEITDTGFIAGNEVQLDYQYYPQINTRNTTYYYAVFR